MYYTKMVTNANIIHLSKDARDVLTSSKYFTRASTKYQWLPRLSMVTLVPIVINFPCYFSII